MDRQRFIYVLIGIAFLLVLYLYFTKPVPDPVIIYQPVDVNTSQWDKEKDSLQHVIAVYKSKSDSLYRVSERLRKEYNKSLAALKRVPATEQVKHFGYRTGDTTLAMQERDSMTLVPLPCIIEANILFLEGDNAKGEVAIHREANMLLERTVEALKVKVKTSDEYIAFLQEENRLSKEKNIALEERLSKKTQTNKTLWGVTIATGSVTVLTVLGLVLL